MILFGLFSALSFNYFSNFLKIQLNGMSFENELSKSLNLQILDSKQKYIIEEDTLSVTTGSFTQETIAIT